MKKRSSRLNLLIKAIIAISIVFSLLVGLAPTVMPVGKSQAASVRKHKRHARASLRHHTRKSSSRHKHRKTKKSSKPNKPSVKPSASEISRGPSDVKKIALTFDAGAGNVATTQILKTLKDANVKATFFLTGKWVEENPGLAKQIAIDGHVIGNHTYSHPHLTKETDASVANQIESAEGIIKRTTGLNTKPLFRAPYGDRDSRVLGIVSNEGYESILWTVDSLDWSTSMSPDDVKQRILSGLCNGAIILEHCGSPQTAQVLPDIINEIKSRGYELVTVPELIK